MHLLAPPSWLRCALSEKSPQRWRPASEAHRGGLRFGDHGLPSAMLASAMAQTQRGARGSPRVCRQRQGSPRRRRNSVRLRSGTREPTRCDGARGAARYKQSRRAARRAPSAMRQTTRDDAAASWARPRRLGRRISDGCGSKSPGAAMLGEKPGRRSADADETGSDAASAPEASLAREGSSGSIDSAGRLARSAARLAPYSCGAAPEFDRLPRHESGIEPTPDIAQVNSEQARAQVDLDRQVACFVTSPQLRGRTIDCGPIAPAAQFDRDDGIAI